MPRSLVHRLDTVVRASPTATTTSPLAYTAAPIALDTEVLRLAPPLTGSHWVAFNGCCAPGVSHRSTAMPVNGRLHFAQRFAIDWKTKRVLRRALADAVPAAIARRKKRGLTVPLAAWLAGPLHGFAIETLGRLDRRLVRDRAVRELLADHVARRRDNRRELWSLIMLQLWLESFASGAH
jgi:hypothetical protein